MLELRPEPALSNSRQVLQASRAPATEYAAVIPTPIAEPATASAMAIDATPGTRRAPAIAAAPLTAAVVTSPRAE